MKVAPHGCAKLNDVNQDFLSNGKFCCFGFWLCWLHFLRGFAFCHSFIRSLKTVFIRISTFALEHAYKQHSFILTVDNLKYGVKMLR